MTDQDNEALFAYDILRVDINDTEQKLLVSATDIKINAESITKTEIKLKEKREALEALAKAKIVSLDEFKSMTIELQQANAQHIQFLESRGKLLKTHNELSAELRRLKTEFQDVECRVDAIDIAEARSNVLEFKKK